MASGSARVAAPHATAELALTEEAIVGPRDGVISSRNAGAVFALDSRPGCGAGVAVSWRGTPAQEERP